MPLAYANALSPAASSCLRLPVHAHLYCLPKVTISIQLHTITILILPCHQQIHSSHFLAFETLDLFSKLIPSLHTYTYTLLINFSSTYSNKTICLLVVQATTTTTTTTTTPGSYRIKTNTIHTLVRRTSVVRST
jgi:hypothetical protein